MGKKKIRRQRVESLRAASHALRTVANELVQVIGKATVGFTDQPCFVIDHACCHRTRYFMAYEVLTTHKPVYVVFRNVAGWSVPLNTPVPSPRTQPACREFWVARGAKLVMIPAGDKPTDYEMRRFKDAVDEMNKLLQAKNESGAAKQRATPAQAQNGKYLTLVTGIVEEEVTEVTTTWKISTSHGEFFVVFDTGASVPFSVGETLPSPRYLRSRAELDSFLDAHGLWQVRYPQAVIADPDVTKSPTAEPCKQAELTYDNAKVQEVNYLFGAPLYMMQVLTECGHTVYFRVPSIGEADNYLPICECRDIIPHPKDTKATLEFWAAKGALDIAVGTVTSTQQAALDSSRHIRNAALRKYESAKRRQARYETRKTPKAAKEDAGDRVVDTLFDPVLTPDSIKIAVIRKQHPIVTTGMQEWWVATSRGEFSVVFPADAGLPFREGDVIASPRKEAPVEFWKRYGAIAAREYAERPQTKTAVDELSVTQGTAVPSEVPKDDMVQRFADAMAAEEVIPYQVVTGSEQAAVDLGNDAIQIYSHQKLGRPETEKVEYLVVTSLGEHIVTYHPNKEFPFTDNQVVQTPDSESLPDFWKRYGAVSMRHKTDADK